MKDWVHHYEQLIASEQKNEIDCQLIALKKQQIQQLSQLHGQFLDVQTLLQNLLNEVKTMNLPIEEMKTDILKIFNSDKKVTTSPG